MGEFDLFIEAEGESGTFSTLAVSSEGVARERGTIPLNDEAFMGLLVRVGSKEKGVEIRQKFGKLLFDAVFQRAVLAAWSNASSGADGVRLRLVIDAAPLAILPWELLNDGLNFLATSAGLAVSRYIPVPEPRSGPVTDRLKVLLVSASPAELATIKSSEVDDLAAAIGEAADVTDLRACTVTKLADAIAAAEYHAVHYLGHGAPGHLLLESSVDGTIDPLSDRAFAQMLFGRLSTRLVVLSACNSSQAGTDTFAGVGPALIRTRLPAVVAMQYEFVQLSTAQLFNRRFYKELAAGVPVDLAVNRARNAISSSKTLLEDRDWSTPVLYLGTRNGRLITLASDQAAQVEKAAQSVASAAHKDAAASEAWQTLQETMQIVRASHIELEALDQLRGIVDAIEDDFGEVVKVAEPGIAGVEFNQIRPIWQRIATNHVPKLRNALARAGNADLKTRLQPLLTLSEGIDLAIVNLALLDLARDIRAMERALADASAELDDRIRTALSDLVALSERTIGRLAAH
jgi:hypothetical protein